MKDGELDPNIRGLVAALNSFLGVATIGSCGGHPNPGPGQWPEGRWYVLFMVEYSDAGWFALEFLAWWFNHDWRQGHGDVWLYPTSPPPYLNTPGRTLRFSPEGTHDPNDLADWTNRIRAESFIPPPQQPLNEQDAGA